MRQTRIFAVLTLSILMVAACCDTHEDPIAPSADVQELVTRSCHIWLNARMMDVDWVVFDAPDAGWRAATNVDEIGQWFQDNMEPPDLWEFDKLLSEISQSELYLENPPDGPTLVSWVQSAFQSFEFIPEEE